MEICYFDTIVEVKKFISTILDNDVLWNKNLRSTEKEFNKFNRFK